MKTWRRRLILLAVAVLAGACTAAPASHADASASEQSRTEDGVEEAMRIRIIAGERTLTAELENSAAGRAFAALLPLDLVLSDYNRTEKVADLPMRLPTDDVPDGVTPDAGDIAYFAPWGNLAIFYRGFGYSRGLVRLGQLEGDLEGLAALDGPVRIEILSSPD